MKRNISFSRQENIFLAAIFVSVCGDALIPTAFALEGLRVDATGSGFTVVLLALWCGRFAGTLLFRKFPALNLKHTMIGADILRLFAQVGLVIWVIMLSESILAMSISSLIYGLATAFFTPARFAITPEIVSKNNLQKFNSVTNLLTDSLMIIAPAVSTSIFLWVGFLPILIFDAITFSIGVILFFFIKPSAEKASPVKDSDEVKNRRFNDFKLLPQWSIYGLLTWLLISLIIGYSGVAGPAFIVNRFSATEWAVVSTALAAGSIVGSAGQLIGVFQKISWKSLQMLAGLLISLQIVFFAYGSALLLIVLFSFSAALIMTSAGISWDTTIQKRLSTQQLRIFANWDSLLTTGAIPVGMLFFGLGSLLQIQEFLTIFIALLCLVSLIPFFTVAKNNSLEFEE